MRLVTSLNRSSCCTSSFLNLFSSSSNVSHHSCLAALCFLHACPCSFVVHFHGWLVIISNSSSKDCSFFCDRSCRCFSCISVFAHWTLLYSSCKWVFLVTISWTFHCISLQFFSSCCSSSSSSVFHCKIVIILYFSFQSLGGFVLDLA